MAQTLPLVVMLVVVLALGVAAFVADPAGVTRGLVIAGWAVLIHAALSVVAAVVAGWHTFGAGRCGCERRNCGFV